MLHKSNLASWEKTFEQQDSNLFESEKSDLKKQINDTGDWDDDIENQFKELVEDFKKTQTY